MVTLICEESRVHKHETRLERRVTCRPEPGKITNGILISPDKPLSGQAESTHFRQRRSFVVCVTLLSGGLPVREESHVRRTAAARRGGIAARRVACTDGASAAALASPALHTAARLPEA